MLKNINILWGGVFITDNIKYKIKCKNQSQRKTNYYLFSYKLIVKSSIEYKNINIAQSNLNCLVMESISELGAGPIAPTVIEPLAIYITKYLPE